MAERTIGLILAGGRGTRLGGVAKHRLLLHRRSLLDHAWKRLDPQCDTIIVSLGNDRQGNSVDAKGLTVIYDREGQSWGPASGLLIAAHWCGAHAPDANLATVAVDSPLLPIDFVARCLDLLPADGAVVASHGDRIYPTHCVWSAGALAQLAARPIVAENGRGPSLKALLEDFGAVTLNFGTHETGANPFSGVNTLAELLELSTSLRSAQVA